MRGTPPPPQRCCHSPWAFRMAALPLPAPEPWFLFFMLFSMGAFFSMSGKMRNRILLPRMYTCSSWATRPSLYVTVMLDIWEREEDPSAEHQPFGGRSSIQQAEEEPGRAAHSLAFVTPGMD